MSNILNHSGLGTPSCSDAVWVAELVLKPDCILESFAVLLKNIDARLFLNFRSDSVDF